VAHAGAGASVVINDDGVSIDGREPASAVAGEVVAQITNAGGRAVANANSVATMEGGASIVKSALDAFGRIGGVVCVAGILRERMLFNMNADELGSSHRDAPEGAPSPSSAPPRRCASRRAAR
jgi:NAD(P)-dependent dehydrogenase (short-subunit alcohol dehydrogenase family)